MVVEKPETAELLRRIGTGDQQALGQLLGQHRARLKRMVGVRMDPRLKGRVDPSDVVQEVFMAASQNIEQFMHGRPLPFYPWLRQLAWNKLVDLHRKHVQAQKRSLNQEDPWISALSDESAMHLADRLASSGTSASGKMLRREIRDRVRQALGALSPRDREVLVLRHLEELSISEIASILGLSEEATKKRQLRALERLQNQLGSNT